MANAIAGSGGRAGAVEGSRLGGTTGEAGFAGQRGRVMVVERYTNGS